MGRGGGGGRQSWQEDIAQVRDMRVKQHQRKWLKTSRRHSTPKTRFSSTVSQQNKVAAFHKKIYCFIQFQLHKSQNSKSSGFFLLCRRMRSVNTSTKTRTRVSVEKCPSGHLGFLQGIVSHRERVKALNCLSIATFSSAERTTSTWNVVVTVTFNWTHSKEVNLGVMLDAG